MPHRLPITLLLILCRGQLPPDAQDRAASASRPAVAPATQPGEFQPGVRIDWTARCVRVAARVLDSGGPLEFFACGGGKEHESALLLEARATHIFQALGLVGLTPGKPSAWDETSGRASPAEGDLVDLRVEWSRDGEARNVHWTEWVLDAEYLRRPLPLPFVFAGSILRPDGRLLCESSGAVIGLVDMSDALLAPTRSRSDRAADLWALPHSRALPPPGTRVTLVLAARIPRAYGITLDSRGDFRVDGRVERPADVADLLAIVLKAGNAPQTIQVHGALAADVRRAAAELTRCGIAESGVRFDASPTARPDSSPSAHPAAP